MLALLCGGALVAACEGDNLFMGGVDPSVGEGQGPVVDIRTPVDGSVPVLPDSLAVSADVEDGTGLASVEIQAVVDPDAEPVQDLYQPVSVSLDDRPTSAAINETLLALAGTENQSAVVIVVTATNVEGETSSETVTLQSGGPAVEITSPADGTIFAVGSQAVPVQLEASHGDGLAAVHLDVIDEITPDSTRTEFCCNQAVLETTEQHNIDLPSAEGTVRLVATAVSVDGLSSSHVVTLAVSTNVPPDTVAPAVGVAFEAGERMEMDEVGTVTVTARDAGAIDSVAATVIATGQAVPESLGPLVFDTVHVPDGAPVSAAGGPSWSFEFTAGQLYAAIDPMLPDTVALPDTLGFRIHALAWDTAGLCAAAVLGGGEAQSLSCGAASIAGAPRHIAEDGTPVVRPVAVVDGHTVGLPQGGVIADAAVDTTRGKLYLSNFSANQVAILDLATEQTTQTYVGSQPWGLFINQAGDSLAVANSGGTNISFVHLDDLGESRLRIPNQVLVDVSYEIDDQGLRKYTQPVHTGFSDRPQFIAQDSAGRYVFSTVPTGEASAGTIRMVREYASGIEAVIVPIGEAVTGVEESYAIANIDSAFVTAVTGGDDQITLYDHIPGTQTQISATNTSLSDAATALETQGSDITLYANASWNVAEMSLSDTTYVAASGNQGWIAFGEGATSPTGRIMLWDASKPHDSAFSNAIAIQDLLDNASERVLGVGLNQGGGTAGSELLGVARGGSNVYFFNRDLGHEGQYDEGIEPGAAGAALHPQHNALGPSSGTTLAFVGSGRNSVKIVDTYHFDDLGYKEIAVRDEIVGPLRSITVDPGDPANSGLTCPGGDPATDPCVILRLYGVTDPNGDGVAEGIVVVDVRRRDIAN